MPYPSFYDAERTGTLYTPDTAAIIREGQANATDPAHTDEERTLLLLIDIQMDFCHEDGSLFVPGAPADTRRTAEWIYENVGGITTIAASLDSHTPNQIFYPGWWVDADGNNPEPYTQIQAEDVDAGRWQPTVEREWSVEYVHKLEEEAKKVLTIWPYHCMIGTPGHRLMPSIYEAVTYHAAVRGTQPEYIFKGTIAKSEFYSLLEPEIDVPEHPNGTINTGLLEMITAHENIILAGQAKSHCVLESTRSIVSYFAERRPEAIAKMTLLTDCTSAVAHPEVDFDAYAEEQLADFYEQGLSPHTSDEVKVE